MNTNSDEEDVMHADDLTDAEREELEADSEAANDEGGDDEADGDKKSAKADEAGEGEDAGDEGEEEEQAAPVQAPLRAEAPTDAKERLEKLDADAALIEERFENGDITAKEYREGLKAIEGEKRDVEWAMREAGLASKMAHQAEENAWVKDVQEFMTTTAAAINKSQALMTAFDQHVKAVTGDAANSSLSNRAQLNKAWKAFQAELAGLRGEDAPKPKAAPDPAPKSTRKRPEPPITLARVPASEIEDTGDGGRFEAIDRLASDPDAHEAAIAKLSNAERRAYLNGA